jgi:hypothetical protein
LWDLRDMTDNSKQLVCDFVDYVMPGLTPYESALYLLLSRQSVLHDNSHQVRIGKKRVAGHLGVSARAAAPISFAQVTEVFEGLKEKGCIKIGDTTREGTLYTIIAPREIPFVKEKLTISAPSPSEDDYFNNPDKRLSLFERDKWTCQYCGQPVTKDNATLDHYVPQSKDGGHSKENLRTCCLICNSIKSGKSFEEAAPSLLKSMQERRERGDT